MRFRSRPSLPSSPFVPGPGGDPPVLAGREDQKESLEGLSKRLVERKPPATNAIAIGPRGNGKTALLGWMEKQAKEKRIDFLWITPSIATTLEELARLINTKSGRLVVGEKEFEKIRFDLKSPEGAGGGIELGWRQRQSVARQQIGGLLARRARRKPFLLLVDEAHTLDLDVGAVLLNEAQSVAKQTPFLLALAGTPDLRPALKAMHATFWIRSRKLGVGLLSREAARLAIEKPLSDHRVALEDAALWDEIVADSQGYPYFVQYWGDELWKRAEKRQPLDGAFVLTREDVDASGARVQGEKAHFYSDRHEELAAGGLVAAAQAVAEMYASKAKTASFLSETLEERLEPVVGEAAGDTLSQLEKVGFVWCPPDDDSYAAGIPNLMKYTLDRAAKVRLQKAKSAGLFNDMGMQG